MYSAGGVQGEPKGDQGDRSCRRAHGKGCDGLRDEVVRRKGK